MFKFLSFVVEKMGVWFGIIFKLVLPLLVMYMPIKSFAYSIAIIGVYYNSYPPSIVAFGIVVFGLSYIVLLALLIWFPKVASAFEFVLMAIYIAFLATLFFGGNFSSYISHIADMSFWNYASTLPLVLVFLVGKIIFFFFIRENRKQLMRAQRHDELLYDSDSTGYVF